MEVTELIVSQRGQEDIAGLEFVWQRLLRKPANSVINYDVGAANG